MPGGVLQLAAYGVQNLYLTGNPQITFFVAVYKRHTNFAIESIRVYLTGIADFGKRVSCVVERYADLICDVFVEVDLPRISLRENEVNNIYYSWTNSIGHALLQYMEIEIGGEVIDRHYGQWLEIWNDLTIVAEKRDAYNEMIGKHDNFNATTQGGPLRLRIPLQFWFCRNKGLALPLIALQFHEVRFNFQFRPFEELWASSTGKIVNDGCINMPNGCMQYPCSIQEQECCEARTLHIENAVLFIDYIFLDVEERRKFAQCKHEYLIDQLELHSETINNNLQYNKIDLSDFNHPVKELIWVFQTQDAFQQRKQTGMELFNFNAGVSMNPLASDDAAQNCDFNPCSVTACIHIPRRPPDELDCNKCPQANTEVLMHPLDPMLEAKIQFEGNDRICTRDFRHFRIVQPYQRHTRVPDNFIYLYSFGFCPEDHQPSGAANFSMLDNVELHIKLREEINEPVTVDIYAVNYNILQIQNGQGRVFYSN